MTDHLNLHDAMAALDEYGYEQKHSSELSQARTHTQMDKYLRSLDFNLRRLMILQEVVGKLVDEEQANLARQENIQTYKTKVINLSREYGISYDRVLEIMQHGTK
ncbi:hypothetical protein [Shewanella spartinae]|uniref:hypothetical protein n=1 Tax=Shewanella spartinae TaxID=2864205 RepID=UPI001C65AB3D|nr:hypothetical protein [Shewanella spartinae]QYJ92196.1 hypothetical protein K0I31_11100 [Shewanella spartinae]